MPHQHGSLWRVPRLVAHFPPMVRSAPRWVRPFRTFSMTWWVLHWQICGGPASGRATVFSNVQCG